MTSGLFGSNNNANPTSGSSLFGQPQQQQQQQQQQQPTQQAGNPGSLFGNTGGSSLFGAKPATATTGGLFGSQPTQQPGQTSSLFGNSQSGGLFGSTNNSLGLQNQQEQQKPAGGLFGGGSLFGQQNQQQPQQAGATGGMFGSLGQSQPGSTSLFGSQTQQPVQQQNLGGSLFGGLGQSTQQPQLPQPSLTASLDHNPYGRNELFIYSGQKLDYGSTTKKPALPPLTSSSFRITPSSKNQISKLRGFASSLSSSQSPARSASPLSGLGSPTRSTFANSPVATDRYKGLTDAALTPNAFVPRPSIKRLTVTPKSINPGSEDRLESVLGKSALRSSTSTPQASSDRGTSSSRALPSNPSNGANGENGEQANPPSRQITPIDNSLRMSGSERPPKKGEYWCKPKLEKLRQMGRNDLRELHDFTAGRRGYGEVTFLELVDLTALDLSDLLGRVIVFSDMELAVYPDDYNDKPERGHGLNVPAQITLENCFSKDKATKQPITIQSDPRHLRFLKRVKTIPDTDFVSYTDDGSWTFKVEHFSRYGIGESDDDSDASPAQDEVEEAAGSREVSSMSESSDGDFLPPTKGLRDDEEQDIAEDDSELEDEEGLEEDDKFTSDSNSPSQGAGDLLQPSPDSAQLLKAKIGAEGMRKLREMQSDFFDSKRSAKADFLPRKRALETGAFFREAEEEDQKFDHQAVKVGSATVGGAEFLAHICWRQSC